MIDLALNLKKRLATEDTGFTEENQRLCALADVTRQVNSPRAATS